MSDYVTLVHVVLGEFMLCWGRSCCQVSSG